MPRMGTYTQADADRDIAVHAALVDTHGVNGVIAAVEDILDHEELTTGIHGVGSSHVAGFGVAGQEVSKVVWKAEPERALNDDNRTVTQEFTELDLTAYTSARAKFAILKVRLKPDVVGAGITCSLSFRRTGDSPSYPVELQIFTEWAVAARSIYTELIVGLNAERKVDYRIYVGSNWTLDTDIYVMGYIE